jgi:hypothetical protein
LSKLKDILDGWYNVVWPSEAIEKEAERRAVICSQCPMNQDNKCKKCGCYLVAKLRSTNSKCPLNKW